MVDAGLLDPKPISAPIVPDTGKFYEKMTEIEDGDYSAEIKLIPVMPPNLAHIPVDVIAPGTFAVGTGVSAGPMAMATTTGPVATTSSAMPMLALPVAGTSGQRVEYHFHQSFNAGTIGAPWDVARAVEVANRRIVRLMPRNP